jgi:hypothetical protein
VEGALVLRQVQGRNDAARAVRPAAEQLVRTYLPEAPARNMRGPAGPSRQRSAIRAGGAARTRRVAAMSAGVKVAAAAPTIGPKSTA